MLTTAIICFGFFYVGITVGVHMERRAQLRERDARLMFRARYGSYGSE